MKSKTNVEILCSLVKCFSVAPSFTPGPNSRRRAPPWAPPVSGPHPAEEVRQMTRPVHVVSRIPPRSQQATRRRHPCHPSRRKDHVRQCPGQRKRLVGYFWTRIGVTSVHLWNDLERTVVATMLKTKRQCHFVFLSYDRMFSHNVLARDRFVHYLHTQWIGHCLLLSKSNSIPQGATIFHPVSLAKLKLWQLVIGAK